jgi:hypothetical protein
VRRALRFLLSWAFKEIIFPGIHFPIVSHLCTQSLQKLRLKWTQAVQYKEVANFGILHMMLVFRSVECKDMDHRGFHWDFKGKPERSSSMQ